MTTNNMPVKNTDRELWRESDDRSQCTPSIHVTQDGSIGINVGGTVIVRTLREWHAMANAPRCSDAPSREWISTMADGEDKCASVSARSPDAFEKQEASGVEVVSSNIMRFDNGKGKYVKAVRKKDHDRVVREKDATIAELRAELERMKQPQFSEVFMEDESRWTSTIRAIVERVMMKLGADNTDFRERDKLIALTAPLLEKHERAMHALRTRAEAAEAKCAEIQAERERADRVTHVVLSSLKWTGDGYEWTGGRYDYRMNPSEAVAATMNEFNRLTAQLAAAEAKCAELEKKNGILEAIRAAERKHLGERTLGDITRESLVACAFVCGELSHGRAAELMGCSVQEWRDKVFENKWFQGNGIAETVEAVERMDMHDAKIADLTAKLAAANEKLRVVEGESKGWHGVVVECEKILKAVGTAEKPLTSNLPNLIRDRLLNLHRAEERLAVVEGERDGLREACEQASSVLCGDWETFARFLEIDRRLLGVREKVKFALSQPGKGGE